MKFKNKMAIITSKAEVVFKAAAGSTTSLTWTIQNVSDKPWPALPLLKNFSTNQIVPINLDVLNPQ